MFNHNRAEAGNRFRLASAYVWGLPCGDGESIFSDPSCLQKLWLLHNRFEAMMAFTWETECYLCKAMKPIQHIIGKEPYCDECYEKVVKRK